MHKMNIWNTWKKNEHLLGRHFLNQQFVKIYTLEQPNIEFRRINARPLAKKQRRWISYRCHAKRMTTTLLRLSSEVPSWDPFFLRSPTRGPRVSNNTEAYNARKIRKNFKAHTLPDSAKMYITIVINNIFLSNIFSI